jgi:hypothetical protein
MKMAEFLYDAQVLRKVSCPLQRERVKVPVESVSLMKLQTFTDANVQATALNTIRIAQQPIPWALFLLFHHTARDIKQFQKSRRHVREDMINLSKFSHIWHRSKNLTIVILKMK